MINLSFYRLSYFLLLLAFCGISASAQDYKNREFCENNNWSNGDKISVHELREMNVPASNSLNVDGRKNGGIRVIGESRSDVLVRACVQAWGNSESEAQNLMKSIRIETGSTIRAEGSESNWSVSYEIHTPRNINLQLNTHNGGIKVSSVEGAINFGAENGGVALSEIAGEVRGRTTNGGIKVELSGNGWKGKGLDVETTNGGVSLTVPSNYAAHLEAQTTNGGFKSDIGNLDNERNNRDYRSSGVKISKDINGGGALVRLVTTNGGVRINSK